MHHPQAHTLDPVSATAHQPPSIAVTPADPSDALLARRAGQLARELLLPLVEHDPANHDLLLIVRSDRIELHQPSVTQCKPVYADLLRRDIRIATGGASKRQPIARALGLHKRNKTSALHVVDATAGLGQDAWLLASLGCRVTAIERSSIVAALLRDGLRRASLVQPEVAQRITLVTADACEILPTVRPRPDVVYLDPMFPPKRKSALERRSVRLLRMIVGPDADATDLFEVSLAVAGSRVVVKRPRHALPLTDRPTSTHLGKSVRYDVYATSAHRAETGGQIGKMIVDGAHAPRV